MSPVDRVAFISMLEISPSFSSQGVLICRNLLLNRSVLMVDFSLTPRVEDQPRRQYADKCS